MSFSASHSLVDPQKASELLDTLNPAQAEAAQYSGQALLIVAGAGSGKTRALTYRIAHLLASGKVMPHEVLAITFTNKTAAEMREKTIELVGQEAQDMWLSTFHSFGVKVLRREAEHLGIKRNFSIYDSQDTLRLITMIAKDFHIDLKTLPPKNIQGKISSLKNELIGSEEFLKNANMRDPFDVAVSKVFPEYEKRMLAANALDFDDLIGKTVELFSYFPMVADSYRRRFRQVLIDEYQDTNFAQYSLVRQLIQAPENLYSGALSAPALTVVGDSDQSIYAFRGADIRNITEFEKDFSDAKVILLEQNYRSTQNILQAANAVISKNSGRQEKNLWTAGDEGEKIHAFVGMNERQEADFIVSEIEKLKDMENISYEDVAIFYRANAQSRVIEEALITHSIPYQIIGGMRFYDRREVKDVLAYLKVISNPSDDVSGRRIINMPKRSVGDASELRVAQFASDNSVSFMQAAYDVDNIVDLSSRAKNSIIKFTTLIDDLTVKKNQLKPTEFVETVIKETGYMKMLESSKDPQDETRLENLAELVNVTRDFEQTNPEATIDDFLEQAALASETDKLDDDTVEGPVKLMTIHTAKGLEFPIVFVTGLEEGVFPHARALSSSQEMEEERRLAYVAITRARENLYLSRGQMRNMWGQPNYNPPSPFLEDIPEDIVLKSGVESGGNVAFNAQDTFSSHENFSVDFDSKGGVHYDSSISNVSLGQSEQFSGRTFVPRTPVAKKPPKEAIVIDSGDKVWHAYFGEGKVISVEGKPGNTVAIIEFSGEEKRILLERAPLEKVE